MEEELVAVPMAPLVLPEPPVPSWSRPSNQPPMFEHRFVFDGRASEYFRIWIVNLALTVLSLGLFSAWAKVRTQRYFYGSTRVAGVPFEYTAKPLPILKGRIIAVSFFSSYVVAGQYNVFVQLGLALFIAVLTPWLIVRGAAFRARYSSWRGLNFRFIPDYGEAYIRFLFLGLPLILSLGLLYPWVKGKQKAFIVENHRFGGSWFKFLLGPGQFYPPYLIAWGVISVWIFIFSMAIAGMVIVSGVSSTGEPPPGWLLIGATLFMYLGYFIVLAFLAAALANLIYNHIEIDGRRFRSTLKGKQLLWIYAGNTVAILGSAGLLIPWAMVRLARYRADCLCLIASDDFNSMVAERSTGVDATAAEVDGLFDIDIGL